MALATNHVYQGDCIKLFEQIEPGSVDLVFADPPFNIGYQYDVYHDERADHEYLDWSREWMAGVAAGAEAQRHVLAGHRRRICRRVEADRPA